MKDRILTFSHSGNIGDILYSLNFITEFIKNIKKRQYNKFDFNIKINVKAEYRQEHPYKDVRMTQESAEFLKPLLEETHYFNNVLISEQAPDKHCFDLDIFRKMPLNFVSGDIREWYYNMSKIHLPQKFEKPILKVNKNLQYKDKIIIISTNRYQNVFMNFKLLKNLKEHFIFLGLPQEHEIFIKNNFDLPLVKVNNALEAAEIINGAKGIISNQSGLYSIAECLKVNRILLSPEFIEINEDNKNKIIPGPGNVIPCGGWFEYVQIPEKLLFSTLELMKTQN